MWRTTAEFFGESKQIKSVTSFKFLLANQMLFLMMKGAETDHPRIRRLETNSPVRTATNVSALNLKSVAAWHRAMVSAHPCTVRGTFAAVGPAA
jgi:hypothetical protein